MYEYPFGNGQQLNLDWFLSEWKNLLAAWEAEKNGIEGALQAEIDKAEAALADVFAARDAAAQSAANALESKNAAEQSARDASGYLSTVQQNATAAQDAARNAAQSESNAADSAQTALASKNAAGQSERNAAQSKNNADTSKRAAAQSAADALANKDAAAQSASDAEEAAASVEASALQITTNTNDIADLKELTSSNTEQLNKIEIDKNNLSPLTYENGYIVGQTIQFQNKFPESAPLASNFETGTYSVGMTAQLRNNASAQTGVGIILLIKYSDNSYEYNVQVRNDVELNVDKSVIIKTNPSKTINSITFGYADGPSNMWAVKNIFAVKGEWNEIPPDTTVIDAVARNEIAKLQALVLENIGG